MSKPGTSIAKGRAVAARPLACSALVCVGLCAATLGASTAAASESLKAPELTRTSPASPSTALRPLIGGNSEGVVTSTVGGGGGASGGGSSAGKERPTDQIVIYAEDATCTEASAIVGEGNAAQLEAGGIPVTTDVKRDWTTTFYARQLDPAKVLAPSPCSAGLPYRQVTTTPDPPTFTATSPVSPAAEVAPHLLGSAAQGSTVNIFAGSDCLGAPIAVGTAASFGATGISVSVAPGSTTTFHATTLLAGLESSCSTSSITYQQDLAEEPPVEEPPAEKPPVQGPPPVEERPAGKPGKPANPDPPGRPPAPTLTVSPTGPANDNTPTLSGKAPRSSLVKVYGQAGCDGPLLAATTSQQLSAGIGVHVADDTVTTFFAESIDGGHDHSPCSDAPVTYIEDSTPPRTKITAGPSRRTHRHNVVFRFGDRAKGPVARFYCRVDGHRWKYCQTPLRLRNLSPGRHILRVESEDAAGNRERKAAVRRFRVIGSTTSTVFGIVP